MYYYANRKEIADYGEKVVELRTHFELKSDSAVIRFLIDKAYAWLHREDNREIVPEKDEKAKVPEKKAKQEKFVSADKLNRKEKEERYGADWDDLFRGEPAK